MCATRVRLSEWEPYRTGSNLASDIHCFTSLRYQLTVMRFPVLRPFRNPHVFAGKNDGAPIINFRKAWDKIREEADLDNFRLHDLRHNFASAAINAGTPLAVVGALLGHKNTKTTQRYAHLADSVVVSAGNDTAQSIADKVAGTSEVI